MTHTPMFNQVEGLVIDESTHLGHLKWVLAEFCKSFFEVDDVKMRYRASHFPFTEPSMEVDINYSREGGQLKIGEGDSWLEILGSGMVAFPMSSGPVATIPRSIKATPSAWPRSPGHAQIRHPRSTRLL